MLTVQEILYLFCISRSLPVVPRSANTLGQSNQRHHRRGDAARDQSHIVYRTALRVPLGCQYTNALSQATLHRISDIVDPDSLLVVSDA